MKKRRKRVSGQSRQDKLLLQLLAHFGSFTGDEEEDLQCSKCEDFKMGHCSGKDLKGLDCVACMDKKITMGQSIEVFGSPPWE
jgi:hypothetical protein